ncbi:MAG: DnaJ domain-containing protein [Clostridiales Family XIII bacterium]|jgi:curved DNA-binding protein CbpA|nr:DnaJ domain-containing protein [Clostridiales Family XIII bacterium]
MNIDYYEALGVERDATKEEIKKAYRSLSKRYHPDVNDAANATAFFRIVDDAYQTLSDDDKRKAYDARGQTPGYQNTCQDYDERQEAGYSADMGAGCGDRVRPRRNTGPVGGILRVLAKIILFPVYLLVAFLNCVLRFLGGLTALAGFIIFGLGVIVGVIDLFQESSWSAVGGCAIISLIGLLVVTLSGVVLVAVESAKDVLWNFICS